MRDFLKLKTGKPLTKVAEMNTTTIGRLLHPARTLPLLGKWFFWISKTFQLRKISKNPSKSCGAKVDKHASELVNAHYVLNANKDHYARADCADKFFFTVELCEIINLDRVEIASYEFYSSRAKVTKFLFRKRF